MSSGVSRTAVTELFSFFFAKTENFHFFPLTRLDIKIFVHYLSALSVSPFFLFGSLFFFINSNTQCSKSHKLIHYNNNNKRTSMNIVARADIFSKYFLIVPHGGDDDFFFISLFS